MDQYENHWTEAAQRLSAGFDRTAFITSLADPRDKGIVRWWPAWRDDDSVHFQEQLLLLDQVAVPFNDRDPYRHVREREVFSEDGQISEWTLQLVEVREFAAEGVTRYEKP